MDQELKKYINFLFGIMHEAELSGVFPVTIDLLQSARKLSGRNPTTGKYEKLEFERESLEDGTFMPFYFTGIMSYLIFLEIMGDIAMRKGHKSRFSNGIHIALECYSSFNENQIKAIRALRNSLVHKFGLATKSTAQKGMIHKFAISRDRNISAVQLPDKPWDGKYSEKGDDTNTTIYVFDLIDTIEEVYSRMKKDIIDDNVDIKVEGIHEIKARLTYS